MALIALLLTSCKLVAPAQADQGTDPPSQSPGQTPTPTPTPTPAPAGTPDPSPGLLGAAAIASNFDYNLALQAAWGTGAIPQSAAPDVVGAFRFICGAGQVVADDPIVYPGQPGKSHLHQFYGNTSVNAGSTFQSLRAGGTSTCNNGGFAANRSGYWMPAMLDGVGHVVQPDFVSIYYKRLPASDPKCSLSSGDPKAEGNCVAIPNGLKFIMGFNMLNPPASPTGDFHYNCQGPTATPGTYKTLAEAIANCPVNPAGMKQNQLGAIITAPDCWDGKNLDSADHRSHVAYMSYGNWGYKRCDSEHPYVIPTFTLGAWYTVDENLSKWHLASDEMMPGTVPGSTFHADYFEGWDNSVKQMWTDGCINKMLNCSGGDLGNGMQLKGAQKPAYGWLNPDRLVPIPS